ncbi:MAG: hypothetical protein JXP73_05840 [Deltaproteobacteria bacterium]|nr:hypothetical protein [Deltaproteobacteria bacterium]
MDSNRISARNPARNFFRPARLAVALLLAGPLAAAGCDDDQADPIESGEAMLSIDTIPDGIACIRVNVVGEFRSVVSDYVVTPGVALVESLSGLPVGKDVFSANAYSQDCDSITKSTAPMWLSDEKSVNIAQGKSTSVTLTLYKNGRAKVTVEFADQEDAGTDAGPSSDGGIDAQF